jgi:hypothetical protein
MPKSPKKDPLDLPTKKGEENVKGGMMANPKMTMGKSCNTNTLTCKDTSKENTLCCE